MLQCLYIYVYIGQRGIISPSLLRLRKCISYCEVKWNACFQMPLYRVVLTNIHGRICRKRRVIQSDEEYESNQRTDSPHLYCTPRFTENPDKRKRNINFLPSSISVHSHVHKALIKPTAGGFSFIIQRRDLLLDSQVIYRHGSNYKGQLYFVIES